MLEQKMESIGSIEIKKHPFPGFYVVFEGTGGTGKDCCSQEIAKRISEFFPEKETIWIHEPGGTPEAERLRQILKTQKLLPEEEMEYFAQARQSLLFGVVEPVLAKGGVVVSGRNFASSLAYQGVARGLGLAKVMERNRIFIEKFSPDCYVYQERDLEKALSQTADEYGQKDQFDVEGLKFNQKVLDGYRELRDLFSQVSHWIWIENKDDRLALSEVIEDAWNNLLPLLKGWNKS